MKKTVSSGKLSPDIYERAFDALEDMIFVMDSDHTILEANDSVIENLGLSEKEVIGKKCHEIFHDAEEPIETCPAQESLSNGVVKREFYEPYLDMHVSAWVQPILDEEGEPVGFVHQVRDISERKQMQERLQESVKRYRKLTQTSPDAIILVEAETGEIIEANEQLKNEVNIRKIAESTLTDTLEKLQKAFSGIVTVITSMVEAKDPFTAGHQIRVSKLAEAIAARLTLPEDQRAGIRIAGAVHDLGKIAIPADLLSKPGKLSEIEFEFIKRHTQVGYEMIRNISFPWPIADTIYQHHERLDGSGYPQGLSGNDIGIEARIIAVADVVEAMTSHRPYRSALSIDTALNEIEDKRGILYDSDAVSACLSLFSENIFSFSSGE